MHPVSGEDDRYQVITEYEKDHGRVRAHGWKGKGRHES